MPTKKKTAAIELTEVEKLQLEIKLLEAKLTSALRGNTALLEDVKYINSLLAAATGMHDYEVYAAVRARSLTVEEV